MAFNLKHVSSKKIIKSNESSKENYKKILFQVNKFIFRDADSGFFVFDGNFAEGEPNVDVVVNDKKHVGRNFVVVGTSMIMAESVVEGQEVYVYGDFSVGRTPGTVQFSANSVEEFIPTKPQAIKLFLGSGKIQGVGIVTAERIVNKFGANTINILDKDPEQLLEIAGIGRDKLEVIKKSWNKWRSIYEIIATMRMYGVSDSASIKIFNHFQNKSLSVIKNNPYLLTQVESIGFKTADEIARSAGISLTDDSRLKNGVMYVLESTTMNGNTSVPVQEIIGRSAELLQVSDDLIETKVEALIKTGDFIEKFAEVKVPKKTIKDEFDIVIKRCVTTEELFNTEKRIAKELKRLMDHQFVDGDGLSDRVDLFLTKNEFGLDDSQLNAAKVILNNKISILTGGPGTGKTHTIKSILEFFESGQKNVVLVSGEEDLAGVDFESLPTKPPVKTVLAAPTGRASKRIEESTKRKSSTMHRLLKYVKGEFTHNEHNKLKGDVFIFDEYSMVDIWLCLAVLKAIPNGAKIVFVGDVDQLPSVGPGSVLRDLIDSKVIAVSKLSVIHRQALNSNIIVAAHDIIHKKMPKVYSFESESDFVLIEKEGAEDIRDEIVLTIKKLISSGVDVKNIQILTPKKEGEIGTKNLNLITRPLLNKKFASQKDKKGRFFIGDRVMQFKNDKELEIFNGDVGTVEHVDAEDGIVSVKFDDKLISIAGEGLSNLNFSYATTIHKSQGSDYPYVIIPISKSHMFMWDTNLLYTAVTRGKQRVILVGEKKTLFTSISHFKQNIRITSLKDLIIEEFSVKNKLKP